MSGSPEDHIAIQQVLARYCRGIDRVDMDLVRSCYWPDAQDHHGAFSGDREAFIVWVEEVLRSRFTATQHALHQSVIECEGDEAFVETYFRAWHTPADPAQTGKLVLYGRYVDRMEKRGGEWRIALRQLVSDLRGIDPIEDLTDVDDPAGGRRGREDPSYGLRLRP
jgi:hypothetical protein